MMDQNRLLVFLLLAVFSSLAQDVRDHSEHTCLLSSRFKPHRKYLYQYTTESGDHGQVGGANLDTTRLTCQVELEVPQTCRFILHTRNCRVDQTSAPGPPQGSGQGPPQGPGSDPPQGPGSDPPQGSGSDPPQGSDWSPSPSSEAFKTAMGRIPLKFSVDEVFGVSVYPEDDEPLNVLNIKRGIVSALVVPVTEQEHNKIMSTVHGVCPTDYQVSVTGDVWSVALSRDLNQCDHFSIRDQLHSPLALISTLPSLSNQISSSQDCSYRYDNRHLVEATCSETHRYQPYPLQKSRLSSVVTQQLSFQSNRRLSSRDFVVSPTQRRPLHFEHPGDPGPVQTRDQVLRTLRDLVGLGSRDQVQRRTGLFHQLVSGLRGLENRTLSLAVPEMLQVSGWTTWQALVQCGTPGCLSALLGALRSVEGASLETDALVYGLSLRMEPDALWVRELLSMAQFRQSRAVMYALANAVRRFHQQEVGLDQQEVVRDVARFMEYLLNDCSGEILNDDSDFPEDPNETAFLVLKVIGVMGRALQAADPGLVSSVLRCVKRTDIPPANQKAAVQTFRLMDVDDDVRSALMEVYRDPRGPVEKRLAAYLVLMKNPDRRLLSDIMESLENGENPPENPPENPEDVEIRSFVVSHLKNIWNSGEPQTQQIRDYIRSALRDLDSSMSESVSRNLRVETPLGYVGANVIFDGTESLPKEVMLETTLRVFNYNYDVFEVGVEGRGFEPTLDALFGEKGFFPDSLSRVLYWAQDQSPGLREVLDRVSPREHRMDREVPEDLLKNLQSGFQKVLDLVGSSKGPEAIAFLRILGAETGFIKTRDFRNILQTLSMYYHVFLRVLPAKVFSALTSSTENELFFHYIFMENSFLVQTSAGLPLEVSLAGVLAPGARGGLRPGGSTTDLLFTPSFGLEFITHMGVQIPVQDPDHVGVQDPDLVLVQGGLEMSSSVFLQSSLSAKVTISRNSVRLSIAAPKETTPIISISNKVRSVSAARTQTQNQDQVQNQDPDQSQDQNQDQDQDQDQCQPFLSGLRLCSLVQSPGDFLSGDSRLLLYLQPTGDVSEFTATITEDLNREGRKGRNKVDNIKIILKAEGDDSSVVSASLKFNRNKNTVNFDLVVPDYDLEVGLRLAVTNGNGPGNGPRDAMRGVTIDVTNRNIPQLSVTARTRLERMQHATLQLSASLPVLQSNVSFSGALRTDEDKMLDLETQIHLLETSCRHKASLRYDAERIEVEMESGVNSEIQKLIPDFELHQRKLQELLDHVLDQRVAKTDMKLRHIVSKGLQAADIWMDKVVNRFPFLENLQIGRMESELKLPSIPPKLFFNTASSFRYEFNAERLSVSLPVPFGGRKWSDLNFLSSVSVPGFSVPELDLRFAARSFSLPSFVVPLTLEFSVPLLGLGRAAASVATNAYSWEGAVTAGNATVTHGNDGDGVPRYVVRYEAEAKSPISLLEYTLEGTALTSGSSEDFLRSVVNCSFNHQLLESSFSLTETLKVTDKLQATANYKLQGHSPLGLQAQLLYSASSSSTLNSDRVSGDGTADVFLTVGWISSNASYSQRYDVKPLDREGRGESTLTLDSPLGRLHNAVSGVYTDSQLNLLSKTTALDGKLQHEAELRLKDAQMALKSSGVLSAEGKTIGNKLEVGVSREMSVLRIETQAEDEESNRIYSLLTGSLDSNGLQLNSEGSLGSDSSRGLHKSSLSVGPNGVSLSGTNEIQTGSILMENVFSGAVDLTGASLSCSSKAMAQESRVELDLEGKVWSGGLSLNGVLNGLAYDSSTKNTLDLVLNRRALSFSCSTVARLQQMKTENVHTLTLTLWTLSLRSKTNNFIRQDVFYNQDTKLDLKPFTASLHLTNQLQVYQAKADHEGHVRLRPTALELSGSVKAAYGENHHVKHSYELTYSDLAGAAKYNTSGALMDARLSHGCELEFAGLSSRSRCEARIISESLNVDGSVRTAAQPFSLSVDAVVNGDGEIELFGGHGGQIYSKLQLKAQPLALALSHHSRVSTTHGESSTSLDNKMDGLVTPSDQSLTWTLKSAVNDHAYNQDFRTYNDPEKVGLQFSGVVSTPRSVSGRDKRSDAPEFSVSALLEYDKSSECHVVDLPFIHSFPDAFERLKYILVVAPEALQRHIDLLNVEQLIADFKSALDRFATRVRVFMRDLDLENQVSRVKAGLDAWIRDFAVSSEDLELVMNNVIQQLERLVLDIVTIPRDSVSAVRDFVTDGRLSSSLRNVHFHLEDAQYTLLELLFSLIQLVDIKNLTDSSTEYHILERIKDALWELRQAVETLNLDVVFDKVNEYVLSADWSGLVEQLSFNVPSADMARVMESMNDVIVNWIDEYEISNKINSVCSYFRDILLKYQLDDAFKDLMDQLVILVQDFKVEETVQSVVNALKSVNVERVYLEAMILLQDLITKINGVNFRKSIEDLNQLMASAVQSLKEFDYNAFLDEFNQRTAELTRYINQQMVTYEVVQKVEAVREFLREIQSSLVSYLEELKNTKVSDALRRLKTLVDSAFYNDIKLKVQDLLEDARQRILDMDIRNETYVYLQRASQSYRNGVAFVHAHFSRLVEKIGQALSDSEVLVRIRQTVDRVLALLKRAEMEVPSFTVPFTDLNVPAFTVHLDRLQEVNVPSNISVPQFTVFNSYTVPAITFSLEDIKTKILQILDRLREFEIRLPDPEDVFGELKVLYLSPIPDLTFPEITLSEIRFPAVTIPRLNLSDFETTLFLVPEIQLPKVPSDFCLPVFGKLQGEFRVISPQYTLEVVGKVENSTSSTKTPKFSAEVISRAVSSIKPLEFSLQAAAQLEAPRLRKLVFTQEVKASHQAFSVDHQGSLTLTGSSVHAEAKTTTRATTDMYTAELISDAALTLRNGVFTALNTTYNHNLDVPDLEMSSQASLQHNAAASMDTGSVSVTFDTAGNGKWTLQGYSDEGTYTSNVALVVDHGGAKLTALGGLDSQAFKSRQTLTAESAAFSHVTLELRCESEAPYVKRSVAVLNGEASVGDLKVAVTANHEAEFTGGLSGFMDNSLDFLAVPFDVALDVKNKVNSKMPFPLRLSGKVELQNDYQVRLNPEQQRLSCFTLTRFNQYKYSHNVSAENNQLDAFLYASANGEANLDFLTVPLSVPEMTLPYWEVKTPAIPDFSLWDDAGLETLLTNPQQSFDSSLKLHYYKNSDRHSVELDLQPVYDAIISKADVFQAVFQHGRDRIVSVLKDSYHQAKARYVKHQIDTSGLPPRILTVPGYTIPVLNVEVSAFRAEMPAFSYLVPKEVSTASFKVPALGFSVPSYTLVLPSLEFPVVHVPETLSQVQLPLLTLPDFGSDVLIPALGNLTFDFSLKSTVMSVSAAAELSNQTDIVARFAASSTSVFDFLNAKMDGSSSWTRKRGLKVASSVALEHDFLEVNHECTVSFTRRSAEASLANAVKINLPFLNLEFQQEVTGNSKSNSMESKKSLAVVFNVPAVQAEGNGKLDSSWTLEVFPADVFLKTSTQGKSEVMVMNRRSFTGELENEVTFYLSANRLRSTTMTKAITDVDQQEKLKRSSNTNLVHLDLVQDTALEVSLGRIFATVNSSSNNNVDLEFFQSSGRHAVSGELDVIPLRTLKASLNVDSSQPSSLGLAGLLHRANTAASWEKQLITWSGKHQLASLVQSGDVFMSNDESEVRLDLSGSVETHLDFLKALRLPVYHKDLWEVLKFHRFTNPQDLQSLNASYSIVYTKSKDGWEFSVPFRRLEDAVVFSVPELSVALPSWLQEPSGLDRISVPSTFLVPAFHVPFTDLHLDPVRVDLQNVVIPKVLSSRSFEVRLPGFPSMFVPRVDVQTEFLHGNASFMAFTVPDFQLLVPFLGENVQIPALSFGFPSGVFIPAFGAIASTMKVSSPVFNVSTTMGAERRDSGLQTSLMSVCTSSVQLLEYQLQASSTFGFDNGLISVNGKCNLIHSDVSVDWQHQFTQNLRTKRQTSEADSTSDSVLMVDVSSSTFADASFRLASRKDGVTASASSPSVGFLALQIQKRSPSLLQGKLFTRYMSSPDLDLDVLTFRLSLQTPQRLILQTLWDWDFLHQVLEGSKARVPASTEAVLRFLNKHHVDLVGLDLELGARRLKTAGSKALDQVSRDVSASLDALQRHVQRLSRRGTDVLKTVSNLNATAVWERSQDQVQVLMDPVSRFLSDTQLTFPGSPDRLSALEALHGAERFLSGALTRLVYGFTGVLEAVSEYVRGVRIPVPGSAFVLNGNTVVNKLVSLWDRLLGGLDRLLQVAAGKAYGLTAYLREENVDSRIDAAVTRSTKQRTAQAKRLVNEWRDEAKLKVEEVYEALSRERINNQTTEIIDILQSHLYGGLNEFVDLMRRASSRTAPYVRVGNRKLDVDVPLPFVWTAFTDWPTLSSPQK